MTTVEPEWRPKCHADTQQSVDLISVFDDYSRFILAWDLTAEQTAEAISEVVQQAVEWAGMPAAPVETRARLPTERGSGCLADAFEDYLRALQIRLLREPVPTSYNVPQRHLVSRARFSLYRVGDVVARRARLLPHNPTFIADQGL